MLASVERIRLKQPISKKTFCLISLILDPTECSPLSKIHNLTLCCKWDKEMIIAHGNMGGELLIPNV